jgi:hypothetical protein
MQSNSVRIVGMSKTRFWIWVVCAFILGIAVAVMGLLVLMVIVQQRIDYVG